MRPLGTAKQLEKRRRHAVQLLESGRSLSVVARQVGPENLVLLGSPGPPVPGVLDLRGQTTLAQAAAIIASCRCYVGIDSGLIWIAGSLQVPVVGLYGTAYIPAYDKIQPVNSRAIYLQAEGSPALITHSLTLTLLNCRWIHGQFEELRRRRRGALPPINSKLDAAEVILRQNQHIPIQVVQGELGCSGASR